MAKALKIEEIRGSNQYFSNVNTDHVPDPDDLIVKSVVPAKFSDAYHHHPSIELNFVSGCKMEYSFSGTKIKVPVGQMVIFWGSVPHGVTRVNGKGQSTVIYLSLVTLLKWGLPNSFIEELFSGSVLITKGPIEADKLNFPRWLKDFDQKETPWRQLLLDEVQMRIRRFALEEYDVLMQGTGVSDLNFGESATRRHIDEILRFVASNFNKPIAIKDVADYISLSPSYTMTLFKKIVGISINEHITRTRLSHAQMLLANSDDKILSIAMDSGFGSLSSFYDAFLAHSDQTPAAFRKRLRS